MALAVIDYQEQRPIMPLVASLVSAGLKLSQTVHIFRRCKLSLLFRNRSTQECYSRLQKTRLIVKNKTGRAAFFLGI